MNKFILASCLLLILSSCDSIFDSKNTARVLGFEPPEGVRKAGRMRLSAGKDGELYIGYDFDNKDAAKLIEQCLKNNLKRLPVNEAALTDGAIFQYIDRNDSVGYYKLNVDKDGMSYSVGIVDLRKNKIHVYESLY